MLIPLRGFTVAFIGNQLNGTITIPDPIDGALFLKLLLDRTPLPVIRSGAGPP